MEVVTKRRLAMAGLEERAIVSLVFVLFFTSGFAALLYQVIWQRELAIFSGADVYSVTIIIAAFMAGLGCGSLAGGYIADKVSIKMRITLFALSEVAIALFAFVSKWLYYDLLYLELNHLAKSPVVLAGVLFASLLWPTFFMGMSLPLLAKVLTRRIEGAAQVIGALYGFNTLGAAVGAFATVWFFIRAWGFETTVHFGAALNIAAATGALIVAPYFLRNRAVAETSQPNEGTESSEDESHNSTIVAHSSATFPIPVWILIYALSGFVALSLEIVWFRLLGVMLKSTAFTFGNLLAIFLSGLAYGTFRGNKWARTSNNPAQVFLALQAGITIYAAVSIILFSAIIGNNFFLDDLWAYFGGYDSIDMGKSFTALSQHLTSPQLYAPNVEDVAVNFVVLYFALPIVLIGPPTLMMGISFPFLQKVVQRDVAFLGRRVGWLQTANIFGSMLGAMLTGWVFLRYLGTSSTLKLLLILGGIFLLLYIYARFGDALWYKKVAGWGLATAMMAALFLAVPTSPSLWAKLHGTTPARIISAEDGSGVSVLKGAKADFSGNTVVYANGLGQSEIPFPNHHIRLGMVPLMLHPDPKEIAIIGLGSGATLFAAGGREETEQITCIEIISPQLVTLQALYERRSYGGLQSLLDDNRINYLFTDGRAVIMLGDKKYDIIEADALRPTSAYSGNLYSKEYFTLLKDHLKTGGFAISWAPTKRVRETFVKVFPYVLLFEGFILIGSNEPIRVDSDAVRERLTSSFSRSYYKRVDIDVNDYVTTFDSQETVLFSPENDRTKLNDINTDLFPKDEYLVP